MHGLSRGSAHAAWFSKESEEEAVAQQANKWKPATQIDWSSAVWAGVIAGAVFMMLEMILVPLFGMGSAWGPPRMIAAMLLGKHVLPAMGHPATFDFGVLMVAMMILFVLSIAYAIVLSLIVNRTETGPATAVGAGYGLLLYLVNFYIFTATFPWFAMARGGIGIFSHIVFGLVAGACYKALQHHAERSAPAGGLPHPV